MIGSGILWAVVGGFLLGVGLRSFAPLGWWTILFVLVLAGVVALLSFFERKASAAAAIAAAALFSFSLGIARMHVAALSGSEELNARIGSPVELEGVVFQEPDARDSATLVAVHASGIAGAANQIDAGVLALLPAHTIIAYGDKVRVSGTLRLPEAFDTGLDRQFDYPRYLAAQGIEYQLAFARVSTFGNEGDPLKAGAIGLKQTFLKGLREVLPEPESALAGGITVGDKRSLGEELSRAFQRTSLVHMVVLSGYNITVVLNAVALLLSRMPMLARLGGSASVVAFFILMSGGAASATRAGLMALIAVLARSTRRVFLGERILAVVATGMVVWNPFILAFDPSFQLSVLATLGLVLFTPLVASRLSFIPATFGMREILSSTCATQLMVLPLLLYQTGNLSLVALPANLLALIPVPFAMLASLMAGLCGALFGVHAALLAAPAYALLWYVVKVAELFSSFPLAAVSIPAFSAWWLLVAYTVLFGTLFVYKKQRPARAPAA
ncbi:MAG: hypothetical protein RLZZ416_27 [Candidatus Parcubacteria bacterium]|jgi:competence protein ComEC